MLPKGTCRSAVVIAFCRSLFSLEKNTIYIVSAKRVDVPCTWRVQILHRKHCCNRNDLKKPPWWKRWFSSRLHPRQLTFISKNDALEKLATQRYSIFDIYSSNFWGVSLVTPFSWVFSSSPRYIDRIGTIRSGACNIRLRWSLVFWFWGKRHPNRNACLKDM